MIEIMEQNEDGRSVVLSRSMHVLSGTLDQIVAIMSPQSVLLVNMETQKKPKRFILTSEEMEKLIAAWTQLQADELAKKEAEKKRLAEMQAEIDQIRAAHPEIQVENDDPGWCPRWNIYIRGFSEWYKSEYAYNLDQILEQVKDAQQYLLKQPKMTQERPAEMV